MTRTIMAAAAAAAVLGAGSAAADPSVQVGVGAEYSSGEYGAADETTIFEIPISARLRAGNWSFRARLPFATVDGPGGVVPGEDDDGRQRRRGRGSGVSGGDQPDDDDDDSEDTPVQLDDVNESGVGDLSLSASYTVDLSAATYVDLTGRVRLPTGDEERDLGVGETDYSMSAEIGRDFEGSGVYLMGGYKVRGGAGREDGAQAAVGGYTRLGGGTIAGLEANWSEASIPGADDAAGATAYASFRMSDELRLSLFVDAGFTDNTADYGAGVGLTWRTNFRRPFQRN